MTQFVGDALGVAEAPFQSALTATDIIGSAVSVLTQKAFWYRLGAFVLGGIMLLVGLIITFKKPIAGIGKGVAKTGEVAALL